jgi:predicted ABC-type sugar transport system permease subunit
LLDGTAFSGGEGLVTKTIVGAIIIVCVTIGLVAIIPAHWQTLATGSVLLIAASLNHLPVREKVQAKGAFKG